MTVKPASSPLGQRGVVSLTAHKNSIARRRAKEYRLEIADCGRWAERNFDAPLAGYAVVMWTGDGEATAFWEGASELGPVFLEDHVNTIMRRTVARRVAKLILGGEPEDAS